MKSKLCSVLVVLSIAVLSATAAHAAEPDAVGVEEALTEPGEPDKPADPVTAMLESEVLRYYRGIGAEPTEAELKSALAAAQPMRLRQPPGPGPGLRLSARNLSGSVGRICTPSVGTSLRDSH